MLANGASSKDVHGIEYLFGFPNTSYLQTCQVCFGLRIQPVAEAAYLCPKD